MKAICCAFIVFLFLTCSGSEAVAQAGEIIVGNHHINLADVVVLASSSRLEAFFFEYPLKERELNDLIESDSGSTRENRSSQSLVEVIFDSNSSTIPTDKAQVRIAALHLHHTLDGQLSFMNCKEPVSRVVLLRGDELDSFSIKDIDEERAISFVISGQQPKERDKGSVQIVDSLFDFTYTPST